MLGLHLEAVQPMCTMQEVRHLHLRNPAMVDARISNVGNFGKECLGEHRNVFLGGVRRTLTDFLHSSQQVTMKQCLRPGDRMAHFERISPGRFTLGAEQGALKPFVQARHHLLDDHLWGVVPYLPLHNILSHLLGKH